MKSATYGDKDAQNILRLIKTKKSSFWAKERESQALRTFRAAAARIPAYKDFLKKNKVNPSKIKTFKDFEFLPTTDKNNYLRKYSLEKLCWDGHLERPQVFTSTSGSTGDPFYFPRGRELDWQYSVLAEEYLANSPYAGKGPTLVIIGFGMGVWIGGIITYKAFEIAAQRSSLPISIITPGINKPEIFHALKFLSPHYKETILIGYPPFIKDVIDETVDRGISIKKLNVRLLFAAESFTEKFRDHISKSSGIRNPVLDTLNIYGTADIGAMAYETPSSILIRRLASRNSKLFKDIFSDIHKTPTLAQYNPFFITFESPNEEILLTGHNTIPLVRYAIGDHGGVASFEELNRHLKGNDVDLKKEAKKFDAENSLSELPFVYVYERKDFSTKLYGAIIYPEHIRHALQEDEVQNFVTGKFTLITNFDSRQNQFLEVHIELKPKTRSSKYLQELLHGLILKHLLEKNAEYRNNYSAIPHKVKPRVKFWPHEHHLHFKPGIKQKWVKKISPPKK